MVYDFENAQRPDTELVLSDEVMPLWSPELGCADDIKSPKDLSSFTLIHDENMLRFSDFPTWASWLNSFGLNIDDFEQGPRLSLSSMAIEAAVSEQGVAFGRGVLVQDEL